MRRDDCVDRGRISAGEHRRASARESAFYRREERDGRDAVNAAIGTAIMRMLLPD